MSKPIKNVNVGGSFLNAIIKHTLADKKCMKNYICLIKMCKIKTTAVL